MEYFFLRFGLWKNFIALSEKKPPLSQPELSYSVTTLAYIWTIRWYHPSRSDTVKGHMVEALTFEWGNVFFPRHFDGFFLKIFFKKQKNVTILALRWSVQNCAENTGRASSNTERRIQNRGHYGQIFKIASNNYVTFFLFEVREIRYLINFMSKSCCAWIRFLLIYWRQNCYDAFYLHFC